ncbi:MAG: M14 family metallopeptidase [Candidatus Kariarchaeaceae archaeon]|jgi:murein tripeptide amidase MpaA
MALEQLTPITDGFEFKYLIHSEINEFLDKTEKEYPNLIRVEVIGKTFEGREIWCAGVTNYEIKDATDKPAYYVDANIHAGEVTGSVVALYTIHYLCSMFGKEKYITDLMNDFTIYIVPRISADGSEMYLTTPYSLRSSTRFWPYPEKLPGFHREDINDDGEILLMRKEDPSGDWKVSEKDPRLLLKRSPEDREGKFYRLFPEGMIQDWKEGDPILLAPTPEGLDLNRNNPSKWAQEFKQRGAGPFPLSEPETRAIADFFRNHPNISGVQSFHTFTGVILRPYSAVDDMAFETHDLEVYQTLGKVGEKLTDYPCVNIFKDFKYEAKAELLGGFLDWVFEHLGIYSFSTELWDMIKDAGVEERDYIKFLMYERTEEEELKLLAWNDKVTNGNGFKNWEEFDHPQLGKVEIGGWKIKYTWQNPPLGKGYLEKIAHTNALFAFAQTSVSPLIRIAHHSVEKMENNADEQNWKISLTVANEGFLPTYGSKQALQRKVIKENELLIECVGGATLYAPTKNRVKFPHLEGRSNKMRSSLFMPYSPEDNKWKYEFVVQGNSGSKVQLTVSTDRGGREVLTLDLE